MTSHLTVEQHTSPIQGLQDILQDSNYNLMVLGGTADESYFSEATEDSNPVAKALWNTRMKGNRNAFVQNNSQGNLIHSSSPVPEVTGVCSRPCLRCILNRVTPLVKRRKYVVIMCTCAMLQLQCFVIIIVLMSLVPASVSIFQVRQSCWMILIMFISLTRALLTQWSNFHAR